MPATQIYVRPNTEIDKQLKETFAEKKPAKIILLLESSTDIETGDTWDSCCCKVECALEPFLDKAEESTIFMMVEVGDKSTWSSETNMFKKHGVFQLKTIPTILVLTSPDTVAKRIEGEECLKNDVISELFK